MPYNLLLLPLVAGYFILTNFVYFKYKYQRLPSQRLLFSSIIAGIFVAAASILSQVVFRYLFPSTYVWCGSLIVESTLDFLKTRFSAALIFGLLASLLLVPLLNRILKIIFGADAPINHAVNEYGDELEQLFRDSVVFGWPLQITLKNDKVYLGFVDEIPEPKKTNYLKFLPLYSGYRDERKTLALTTSYETVHDMLKMDGLNQKIEMMIVVLKQDEILSASPHDAEVYSRFVLSQAKNT